VSRHGGGGFLTVALLPFYVRCCLPAVGAVVFGLAGIEGVAAFERWIENALAFSV